MMKYAEISICRKVQKRDEALARRLQEKDKMTADEKADTINKWIDYAREIGLYSEILNGLYPEILNVPHVKIFYLRNCRKFIAASDLCFLSELEEMQLTGTLDESKLSDSADGALDIWANRWSIGQYFPGISEMQMMLAIAGKN